MIIFLLMIVFNGSASASDELKFIPVSCQTAKSFYDQVYNCGHNTVAVRIARQCSDDLMRNSKANGKALAKLMKSLQKELKASQSNSMTATANRLREGIIILEKQIADLQANTAKVANYTEAMIDFPDGVDDKTSASCFSSAFHSLQKIVNNLDAEIIRSKDAHEEAVKLLQVTQQHAGNLKNIIPGAAMPAPARAPASVKAEVPDKRPAVRQSTITGIKEKKSSR